MILCRFYFDITGTIGKVMYAKYCTLKFEFELKTANLAIAYFTQNVFADYSACEKENI